METGVDEGHDVTSTKVAPSSLWTVPGVAGKLWWPFLAIWAGCFVFALMGTFFFARDDVHLTPSPEYALGFVPQSPFAAGDPTAGSAVWIVLSREAQASGLRKNDRVVSMNGHVLAGGERPIAALWNALGRPSSVTIDTVSPSGRRIIHHLTYSAMHGEEGIGDIGLSYRTWRLLRGAALLLFETGVPLAMGLLLLVKRSREPLAPWVSLSFVLNAITSGAPERASVLRDLLSSHVWAFFDTMTAALALLTLTLFPDGKVTARWFWLVLAIDLAIAIEWLLPLSWSLNTQNIVNVLSFVPAAIVMAAKYRSMPPGPGRQQIRWVLLSIVLALIVFAVGVMIQTVEFQTSSARLYFSADVSSILIFDIYALLTFAGMTIGLMRYRLYDADATINRSIVYGALTVGLLGVFAGSEKLIEIMGEQYFGERLGALAGALGAATAAVMIVPLHHRITHWAEKRFRSGLALLRHGLPLLVGDMRETASAPDVADAALMRVEGGVRASYGAVIANNELLDVRDVEAGTVREWLATRALRRDARALQCDRADPLFPIRLPLHADGPGFVGWLLLGPRPDGSFYGREERNALVEIADPLARALAVAIERERREMARQDREDFLTREVRELKRLMHQHLGMEQTSGRATI